MKSSAHKTTVKDAWTLERSRKLVVLLIALVLPSLSQSESLVSANNIGAISVLAQQITSPPVLPGSFQVVHTGPGDQVNPQVDCNLASYTDDQGSSSEIRSFDFNTSTNQAVPTPGLAFLSDVSGTRITYTSVTGAGNQIGVFDSATSTTTVIPGGNQRTNPSIGGNTVAFEDRSFSSNPNESEIVVYDLATGTTARLTNDSLMDTNPEVSPDGNVVVFQKCQTNGFGCDIYVSRQTEVFGQTAPRVWITQQVTGTQGEETNPKTNGTVVVYTSTRSDVFSQLITDVFYQPITGGPETQIAIPGDQRNPSISSNLISFESQMGTEYDIFVYDITHGDLFQVTSTPGDETLNDITVCGSTARIVYSVPGPNSDFDVLAFTFTPPSPVIAAASSTLVNESCPPANGTIDPGETATISLRLVNNGTASTRNLTATLQPNANVLAPSGPQSYGAISPSATGDRDFTFTAAGNCGDVITLTLQLQDGVTNLGTVSYNVTLGCNTACAGAPRINISSTLSCNGFDTVATVTITNSGTATAFNVMLTTAKLAGISGRPLPQSIGNLAPGQSNVRTVTFSLMPVGPTTSTSTLQLGGSYAGGSFNSNRRVTAPICFQVDQH